MNSFVDYIKESLLKEDGDGGATNVVGSNIANFTPPIAMTSRKFGKNDEFVIPDKEYFKIKEQIKGVWTNHIDYLKETHPYIVSILKESIEQSDGGFAIVTGDDSNQSIIVRGKSKKQLHNEFQNNQNDA